MDILKASAAKTRHSLNPNFSVLVECYFVLGLERRLRKYERIRDIMNSWDRDQQNSLLILPCVNSVGDEDLDLGNVPRTEEPPTGFCMQMYHSSRPGKWNKRWVTLLDNGQMFAAKSEDSKPSDKESLVMCHLTDFDIYAPKESELKKTLKPPKRFCFAIKSQQRTVVFANGENFVHFFSTDDTSLATRFYDGVHAWRSWYLVNRMVDIERRNKVPQLDVEVSPNRSTKSSRTSKTSGAERPSTDETTQGNEPLMNVNQFRMSKMVIPESNPANLHRSSTTKTVTATTRVNALRQAAAPRQQEQQEFTATGLLGDDYDKRKQAEAVESPPVEAGKDEGPFVSTPTLLNGGVIQAGSRPTTAVKTEPEEEPRSWFPSATEHTARERSKSVSGPQQRRPSTAIPAQISARAPRDRQPAPLLNFTEDFPQPPRLRDTQRGASAPRPKPGQPLINYASGGTAQQPRNAAPPKAAPPRRGMPPSTLRGRIVTGSGTGAPRSALPPPPPVPAGSSRSRGQPPPAGQRMLQRGDGSPARRPRTSGI